MSTVTCEFVLKRGENKGNKCGKACVAIEGQPVRCHDHKENRMKSQVELKKEAYISGKYVTKNQRISCLEQAHIETDEKCKQQEIQIGILKEDLEKAKAEIAALKKDKEQMQLENKARKKEIAELREEMLKQAKTIGILSAENAKIREQFQNSVKKEIEREKRIRELEENQKLLIVEAKWQATQLINENKSINEKFQILESRWDVFSAKVDEAFTKIREIETQYGTMLANIDQMGRFNRERVTPMLKGHHVLLVKLFEWAKKEGIID